MFQIVNYSHSILVALDLIREEETFRGLGPGESKAYSYDTLELENFTPDKDWVQLKIVIEKTAYDAGDVYVENFQFNWKTSTVALNNTVATIVTNNRLLFAFAEGDDTYNNTLLVKDKNDNPVNITPVE